MNVGRPPALMLSSAFVSVAKIMKNVKEKNSLRIYEILILSHIPKILAFLMVGIVKIRTPDCLILDR